MEYKDFENIKLTGLEIPYSKVVDFINFVVTNSYGAKDGRYHEYLMDYSEAVAILAMYTDCDDYEMKFDDVMQFVRSKRWSEIKDELGDTYINFHYYVKKEIEYLNTPMRFADSAIKKFVEVMGSVDKVIKAIDVEALKQYDFSKIIEAVNMVEETDKSTGDK